MKFIRYILITLALFAGANILADDNGFQWHVGTSGTYLHVWATGVDSGTTVTISGIDATPFIGKLVYSFAVVSGETTVDSTVATIVGKFVGRGKTVSATIQTVPTNGATLHADTLNGISDLENYQIWDVVLTTPNLTESLKNGRVDLFLSVNGTINTPFDPEAFIRENK